MKVLATHNNSSSLIVEEKDEEAEATRGVEIIATEESSFSSKGMVDDKASTTATAADADVLGHHQKPKPRLRLITVGGFATAAGALAIVFLAGSNIHSSKQQVQVAALNNVVEVEEVNGYEFVANGFCLDGNGGVNYYDFIIFLNIDSPQACGEHCSQCPGGGQAGVVLRGFFYAIRDASSGCYCVVNDGASQTTLEGACTGYAGASDSFTGIGEIQGTNGNAQAVCYKVGNSPPAPTPPNSKAAKRAKRANAEDTTIQASFMKSGGTFLSPLISASATLAWIMALSTFFTFYV